MEMQSIGETGSVSLTCVVLCLQWDSKKLESCINSLCFQTKRFERILVVAYDDESSSVDQCLKKYRVVDTATIDIISVEHGLTESEVIDITVDSSVSEYICILYASDRVHESLVECVSVFLDGENELIISTVGLYINGSMKAVRTPKKGSQCSVVLRNRTSNFYWGKIWKKEFLCRYKTQATFSLDLFSDAPILISYTKQIAVALNKREPLFFRQLNDVDSSIDFFDHYDVEGIIKQGKSIIEKCNPEHCYEVMCSLVIRLCLYLEATSSANSDLVSYVSKLYSDIVSFTSFDEGERKPLSLQTCERIERVLNDTTLIPDRIFLTEKKSDCLNLLRSLEEYSGGRNFEIIDIIDLQERYGGSEVDQKDGFHLVLRGIEELGGIYLDASLICCGMMKSIQKHRAFFCSIGGKKISLAAFGGEAHHRVFKDIINCLQMGKESLPETIVKVLVGRYGMNLVCRQQEIAGGINVYLSETFLFSIGYYPAVTRLKEERFYTDESISRIICSEKRMLVEGLKKDLQQKAQDSKQEKSKVKKLADKNLKLRNSLSWKVTEPIRRYVGRIRKIRKEYK